MEVANYPTDSLRKRPLLNAESRIVLVVFGVTNITFFLLMVVAFASFME